MGCSALISACLDGFVDVARVLLEYGANVHYQDKVCMLSDLMNLALMITLFTLSKLYGGSER